MIFFVKRLFAIFFLSILLLAVVLLGLSCGEKGESYVRIHIVANSSNVSDERAKNQVKEELCSFLSPLLSNTDEVINYLKKNLKNICGIANEILAQNNFDYKSSAELSCKFFEEETILNVTLKAGNYHQLLLILGEGAGDGDYYVMECGEKTAVYKSRIF
ncbi:MAG: hypothetical protein EOM55_02185 [Clostridia bacterium]|nr:hypothetical protein [Clostridia bacterium]